jgi:cytochrome P450
MRQSFDKKSVEAERMFARASAERLLAGLPRGESVDLIARYTDQISNLVSFHLLGFPLEDCEQIVEWVRELLHSEWPEKNRTARGQGLAGAFPEFSAYLDGLVDARRGEAAPKDLVGRLVQSRLDGNALPATVLRALTAHVVLGGISTTTNLLGNLLLRVLRDEELHARLRAEPDLIPAAVEESLRLDPPVLFLMRVCRRATTVGGVAIEPGETVLVGIASANRDEAVFEEPDAFRLDRGLPRHISFSGGAHHCIGAGLARLVGEEAVGAFVDAFGLGDVALAPGFEFEGVPVFLEWGPERVDVVVGAQA